MADEPTPPTDPPADAGPSSSPLGASVGVEPIAIQEEMERSFLDYAMSVITARALPDARDGLKPVHRRILYGMFVAGLRPDRPFKKSASAVGDVMSKYHPHGDASIYDALARMAQDFSLRYPLIDGHGNFGSPDPNDRPAAMRYTESRLAPLAMRLLGDGELDEETVDLVPNYDGEHDEPVVLPAQYPNLLVNGGGGIAVGMATNIPPHNLTEIINATLHLIDHPESTPDDLMQFVTGPDFPTGGLILGRSGIAEAYRTGRGSIKMRAIAEIDESGARIVVSKVPYQTSVEVIGQKVAELVNDRRIEGIRDVRNESSGDDVKLVVELKRDANAQVVLNQLYKFTPMQTTFAAHMLALVDGVPRLLNLAQSLSVYVEHRLDVVRRRTDFRLREKRKREHIVEGLVRALDMIDAIIALLRAAPDVDAARAGLRAEPFEFSEIQAGHILDMPLRRLTSLEGQKLNDELGTLRSDIDELLAILESDGRLREVVKEELTDIRNTFGDERRTEIVHDPGDLDALDFIDDEELVLVLSQAGYVKTVKADTFQAQARGGKGVAGARLREEDYVAHLVHTTAHSYLLFFSNRGRVYRIRAHELPQLDRTARGTPLVNYLQLGPDERIQAIIDTRQYEEGTFLFFATRDGVVKKTRMSEYDSSLRTGLIALNLREEDELVRVVQTNGQSELLLVSRQGMTVRFHEEEVRPMGRAASGVRGMRLRDGDVVVSCDVARDDAEILIICTSGHGKRTRLDHFSRHHRGGQGVRGIRLTSTRGAVASAFMVGGDDQILVFSSSGRVVRFHAADVSSPGRDATGVRLASLGDGEEVVAAAPVLDATNGDDAGAEGFDVAIGDVDAVAGDELDEAVVGDDSLAAVDIDDVVTPEAMTEAGLDDDADGTGAEGDAFDDRGVEASDEDDDEG
jgi:DNA gyrase subunit A